MPVRVRLDLSYDGAAFSGWAAQPGRETVEGVLTEAISVLAGEQVSITVAGRTDAGVHARGQVAHVDIPLGAWTTSPGRSDRPPALAFTNRLNALLRRSRGGQPDIVIKNAQLAPDGFDARFAALGRRYRYLISDQGAPDPLTRSHVLWHERALDVAAMDAAGKLILGEHDFLAFCKPREGATTIRTLTQLDVARTESGLVEIWVAADAFCHSMVRALVGNLLEVGESRKGVDYLAQRLEARTHDGMIVAPPNGLILEAVSYPADAELTARALVTRARRDS